MKVIIAGGTGLIGGAVLRRLIELPSVTSVVALSRRELGVKDPKVETVILKDFLTYDEETLAQLSGAEACIWALGKPTSGREVHVDYTMAAVNAISKFVVPKLAPGKEFRFVYTSGSAVEADTSKSLWFLSGVRKMRGELQNKVVEFTQPGTAAEGGAWKSFIVRPGLVTTGTPFWGALVPAHYIPAEVLAATMVLLAQQGGQKQIFDNVELKQIGSETLGKSKL